MVAQADIMKWVILVCILGAALAFPSPIRSKEEVKELKQFLLDTQKNGSMTLEEAMAVNPKASPWENSGKYQGDILLHDEEIEEMVDEYSGKPVLDRTGLVNARHRWPGGVFVYDIAPNTFNNAQLNMIQNAVNIFSQVSCTRWVRRTNQRDFVLITGRQTGCYATVGYWQNYGAHTLNLANGCFRIGIVIHEMLHSAGFHHMHQTYNRYGYIWINWQNVVRGMEHNFNVFSNQVVTMLGLPYEYGSNQHYGEWAFSSNGQPTIGARFDHGGQMGQLERLTGWDILRLRRLYNCPGAWRARVNPEDANKPYDDEFIRKLDEAADEELREQAEIEKVAIEENQHGDEVDTVNVVNEAENRDDRV